MKLLVADVAAVIRHLGESRAIVVGHDWGGAISWFLAMARPDLVERLIILNLPHPRGIGRELATNPAQQKNSQYARNFQQPGSHEKLTAEGLAGWVKDPAARAKYVEAFKRSSFDGMMNYYRRNYPREPYTQDQSPVVKVKMPVLMIHGLDDYGASLGDVEQHVGLARARSDARDGSRRRPFRSTGRGGSRLPGDGQLAETVIILFLTQPSDRPSSRGGQGCPPRSPRPGEASPPRRGR